MTLDQLIHVLTKAGARKEGPALLFSADAEVTVLVALEGETMTVNGATRLETGAAPVLVVDTAKGEQFVFAFDSLRAITLRPKKR
jgi:hypothetical protein